MPDITEVSVTFHDEVRGREEYNPPMRKAEARITATVSDKEEGEVILAQIATLAVAKVRELLLVATTSTIAAAEAAPAGEPPARKRPGPKPKDAASTAEQAPASQAADASPPETEPASQQSAPIDGGPAATEPEDWSTTAAEQPIGDKELLESNSAAHARLGGTPDARERIKTLIGSFNPNQAPGVVFKVQDIPAAQRRDYLTKLAALV